MGKQVRFYMRPDDQHVFLEFVLQDPAVVLLKDPSADRTLRPVEDPLGTVRAGLRLEANIIWNTVFALRESDVAEVRLHEYQSELGAFVETGEVVYSVNTSSAAVIQYLPCFLRGDGTLAKGRVWADMLRLEGDQLVHKGKAFEAWYDKIARWLRRNLKRVPGIDGYLGSQALEWHRAGGKLGP